MDGVFSCLDGARYRGGAFQSVLIAVALLGASPFSKGQETFLEPVLVTDGSGRAAQAALALNARTANVAAVMESSIIVKVLSSSGTSDVSFPAPDGEGQGDPDIETDPLGGVSYIAYSQERTETIFVGRDVYLASYPGGAFQKPRNVSDHSADDYAPALALDQFAEPHLVWTRNDNGAETILYYNQNLPQPLTVAGGRYPGITVGRDGRVYLVYTRGRDLYYRGASPQGLSTATEYRVVSSPEVEEFDASIALLQEGRVGVAYESLGSLYLVSKAADSADFGSPILLVLGGVAGPRLTRELNSELSLAYSQGGDIFYFLSDFAVPIRVTETPAIIESQPSLRVDFEGSVHLSYLVDGDVFYTNNSPTPTADFVATPFEGELPLEVQFQDTSSGQIQAWSWDFGDGGTSNQRDPIHVYESADSYSVTLLVIGPGGSDEVTKEDFILVQDPRETMRVPDMTLIPGENVISLPILGTFTVPIRGFQIAGTFDPTVLEIVDINIDNTDVRDSEPELFQTEFQNDASLDGGAYFFAVFALEFDEPPFLDRTVSPGVDRRLLNVVFRVLSPNDQRGTETLIGLDNRLGPKENLKNVYSIPLRSKLPALTPGRLKFLRASESRGAFVRGDVKTDGGIGVDDAVATISFLFLGETDGICQDAADYDDSGSVDVADATALLFFLFLGGRAPAVPYPQRGVDTTEDSLPACDF